jgi:hypothetical protein
MSLHIMMFSMIRKFNCSLRVTVDIIIKIVIKGTHFVYEDFELLDLRSRR